MKLPLFCISIDIDVERQIDFFSDRCVVASKNRKRGLRLPYSEYSELRDFIRGLFADDSKFRTLGFKPSDNALDDIERLKSILPLREIDPDEYARQITQYLKTEPTSKSFYIVADALNDSGNPISRWLFDVRISDHELPNGTLGVDNQDFFLDKYADEHKDAEWLPVRFKITYNIKQVRDVVFNQYRLDIADRFSKRPPFTATSIDAVKSELRNYVDSLWDICNQELPDTDTTNIQSNTNIDSDTSYNDFDVESIMTDINYFISDYNNRLCSAGNCRFASYRWECVYADVDEEDYIIQLIITDNYGETFSLDCDIYIPDYFDDDVYRDEVLLDVCMCLFEGYGPNW